MIKDILKAETTKDDFFRDNSLKFIVTCKATLPDQKFNKKSIKGYFCKKKQANLKFPHKEMNPEMLHRGITRNIHSAQVHCKGDMQNTFH